MSDGRSYLVSTMSDASFTVRAVRSTWKTATWPFSSWNMKSSCIIRSPMDAPVCIYFYDVNAVLLSILLAVGNLALDGLLRLVRAW